MKNENFTCLGLGLYSTGHVASMASFCFDEAKMVSSVNGECEIVDVDVGYGNDELFVEEVEVGNMPLDGIGDDVLDAQPIMVLQDFPDDFNGEVELQTAEVVIDDGPDEEYASYAPDDIGHCMPASEAVDDVIAEYTLPPPPVPITSTSSSGRRGKSKSKASAAAASAAVANEAVLVQGLDTSRRWERKQVQIKTMDGEFCVTMWASG